VIVISLAKAITKKDNGRVIVKEKELLLVLSILNSLITL
jgi:hypothetical protein